MVRPESGFGTPFDSVGRERRRRKSAPLEIKGCGTHTSLRCFQGAPPAIEDRSDAKRFPNALGMTATAFEVKI